MKIVVKQVVEPRPFYFNEEDRTNPDSSHILIRDLPKSERARIKDLTLQMSVSGAANDGGGSVRFANNTVRHMMTVSSICGWHNISTEFTNGDVRVFLFTNKDEDKQAVLNSLSRQDYERLVAFANLEEDEGTPEDTIRV